MLEHQFGHFQKTRIFFDEFRNKCILQALNECTVAAGHFGQKSAKKKMTICKKLNCKCLVLKLRYELKRGKSCNLGGTMHLLPQKLKSM